VYSSTVQLGETMHRSLMTVVGLALVGTTLSVTPRKVLAKGQVVRFPR